MNNAFALLLLVSTIFCQISSAAGQEEAGVRHDAETSRALLDQAKALPATRVWYETVADPKSASIIYKSPADNRTYRYLVLDNGLKVLLISDPEADKAAASLSINIGSFENPVDREGLAHFLEHMLFLGTDRYPEPGEYQAFVSEHGGSFNAYTSLEETNYFFDVDSRYLVSALDRFSRFFISPLFNEEYVDRERHAVDSEYRLKLKDESRREWDVLRELANPEHPFSMFAVGNLDTLEDREDNPVREELLNFYRKYYSASLMSLVVLGSEPLDILDKIVRDRFSPVPSHEVKIEEHSIPLFKSQLPLKVSVRPEKEVRTLSFYFPMPSLIAYWQLKVPEFLGHLLGYEGEGSLLALLKMKGLAEGLSAGQVFDSRQGSLFSVTIRLTSKGVEEERKVTRDFFQWLELVVGSGLEAWRYDEIGRMGEIEFHFVEKTGAMGYVSHLSTSMHDYPPSEILRGDYLFGAFDKGRLEDLARYLSVENVAIVLQAPEVATDRKTQFYDSPYAVHIFRASSLTGEKVSDSLQLPTPNPYIPDNLALTHLDDRAQRPVLLDSDSDVWFAGETSYLSPRAFFDARIAMPGDMNIEQEVVREFILALVKDELSSAVYPARLAGLGFSLAPWDRGIRITLTGYSEKQPLLLQHILRVLTDPDWDDGRIARVKKTLVRRWKNTTRDWPLKQLFLRFPTLVTEGWLPVEKAEVLQDMSNDYVKSVHESLFRGAAGRFYGAGNFTSKEVLALASSVSAALKLADSASMEPIEIRNLKRADPLFRSEYYIDHMDSAALLYLQGETDSLEERATLALLNVMVSAPLYSVLRTEKQLGYAVGSATAPFIRVPGLLFYVQSPKVGAPDLRSEINGFFNDYAPAVESLKQEDLERYRESVLASVEEKPKNLNELALRHLESLDLGFDNFDFREKFAEALRSVTLEQLKESYTRLMLGTRTGFWVLSSKDISVGEGRDLPGTVLEENFTYRY